VQEQEEERPEEMQNLDDALVQYANEDFRVRIVDFDDEDQEQAEEKKPEEVQEEIQEEEKAEEVPKEETFIEREGSGIIKFTVARAKILKKQDVFGEGDPYVVVKYNGEEQKTSVIKDTRDPHWNHGL
jgi:hypothetical protein